MSKVTHRPTFDGESYRDTVIWCVRCTCGWSRATRSEPSARTMFDQHARWGREFSDMAQLGGIEEADLHQLMEGLIGLSHEWRDECPRLSLWADAMCERVHAALGDKWKATRAVQVDLAGGHVATIDFDEMAPGEGWKAFCTCGWQQRHHTTEEEAEAAWRAHHDAFWASVPEGMQVRGVECDYAACLSLDVTCSRCRAVRYVGPDCEHVPQPVPVSAEGVCVDCQEAIQ